MTDEPKYLQGPKSKPVKLANGARMNHGQMIPPAPAAWRRSRAHVPTDSDLHPRNGAPKNFPIAQREHGIHSEDRIAPAVVGAHPGFHPDPKAGHGVPVHDGMHFRDGAGKLQVGISKTQAANPLDDEKMVTAPGKIGAAAPPVVGQRSRVLTGGIEGLRDARLPSQIKR